MRSIIDFFSNIFNYIVDSASAILSWLLGLLTSAFTPLLQLIADSLPDLSSYWSMLDPLLDYLPVVNTFFPLYESGYFISIYVAFIGVFITVKLVVKIFIPFVG